MKKILCGLFVSAVAMSAATINFYSDANPLNEWNSTVNPNVKLNNVNVLWQPNGPVGTYSWISFAQTDGSTVPVPNNNVAPAASFYEKFLVGGAGTGTVRVWADDTTAVSFFGGLGWVSLMAANISQDGACAKGAIACQPNEHADLAFNFAQAGEYQLRFDVYQLGSGPFGLMYTGSAQFPDDGQVPEPASMVFAGVGLAALGLISRRMTR